VDPIRSILTSTARTFAVTALIVMADRLSPAIAQTPNSNAGLEGGQDNLFDAILATPNQKTPVLQDNVFATAPGLDQLSGVVSHAPTTVRMENLVLIADGSFSGTTRAGLAGSRFARASKITGRFSGDSVSLTFESELCPLATV
jgi:hypothetical protein